MNIRIPAQIDLAITLTIFDFLYTICCRAPQKNTVHEVLDFLKNFFELISPKITQKTENVTVGRYWFGWNFFSKLYVRKQFFWAIGESGRGFGLEVIRQSKLKKKIKNQKTKIIEYDGF